MKPELKKKLKTAAIWAISIKILIMVSIGVVLLWVFVANHRKSSVTPSLVYTGEGELRNPRQEIEPRGVALTPGNEATQLTPTDPNDSMNSIVTDVRPAVIMVIVAPLANRAIAPQTGIKMGDPYNVDKKQAVGSGVIIASSGLFLTTKHVVGENNNLQVVLYRAGQKRYSARVIARDPDSPLVIGKILHTASEVFPYAKMGDSDTLRTGDSVVAVGNPFSLSGTVTSGIVSGKKEIVVDGTTIPDAIMIDASINDGNAGGPLVNLDNKIVGINFASYVQKGDFTGIGFALPINYAKNQAWSRVQ